MMLSSSSRLNLFLAVSSSLLLGGGVAAAEERQERDCWDNITAIYEEHLSLQPAGSSNSYTVCPGVYEIGVQYGRGECCRDGQYPMVARANTVYRCGGNRGADEECVFQGGDTHVLINDAVFDEALSEQGAVFEGFTFRSPTRSTSFASSPGKVKFVDCVFEVRNDMALLVFVVVVVALVIPLTHEFYPLSLSPINQSQQEQSNEGPILAIYESGRRRLEEKRRMKKESKGFGFAMTNNNNIKEDGDSGKRNLRESSVTPPRKLELDDGEGDRMTLTFERCEFRNNKFAAPVDILPTYGVVSARSPDNDLVFQDCVFRNNVYGESNGYAVSVDEGSTVSIHDTCFLDNEFHGAGAVQVYGQGTSYDVSDNYGTAASDGADSLACSFLAFAPSAAGDNPALSDVQCVDYDAETCTSALVVEQEE